MDRRLALVLGLVLVAGGVGDAAASTFTVDTTSDVADPKPGDGTCGSGAGTCSLRAAVQESNRSSFANTIELPPGTYTLSIGGPDEAWAETGDLDMVGDVTISGAGAGTTIVEGSGTHRVFDVAPNADVHISDLTVRNGAALGGNGGGILNNGHLELRGVTVSGSRAKADPGSPDGRGGGICNKAHLTAMSLQVTGNTADGRGGGIYNSGFAKLMNATVSGNVTLTDSGGGISNDEKLGLLLCTIEGNHAANGAGIDSIAGEVEITDSTIAGNRADSAGGGIRTSGELEAVNVTIDGNSAGTTGGGLALRDDGEAELNDVTIAGNSAGRSGGGIAGGQAGSVELSNTIVAANSAAAGGAADCVGSLESHGHNLIQSPAGCTLTGGPGGDQRGVDAKLGPLADNGGPTRTRALLPGSPAIDAGSPALPDGKHGACAPADQRGVKRPVDGSGAGKPICDIGAFELDPSKGGSSSPAPSGGPQTAG